VRSADLTPEGGYRHLIIALDVSPSMQLEDAGREFKQSRAKRAGEVLMSVLGRIATDQVRVSIVAFYTGAKPVAVDTPDMEVIKNCLNDLPLDIAFNVGKTALLEGVRASVDLARAWPPDSTTLVIVSDGDAVPDTGLPALPRAISRTLVVGVGDALAGRYIDGHQSRQDASTLRQLAARMKGDYFDANQKHVPSASLAALARALPLRDARAKGVREAALGCIAMGSALLAFLPVALALGGTAWQAGTSSKRSSAVCGAAPARQANLIPNQEMEKPTYA
jgi:Ca-activated chloride channel family protein